MRLGGDGIQHQLTYVLYLDYSYYSAPSPVESVPSAGAQAMKFQSLNVGILNISGVVQYFMKTLCMVFVTVNDKTSHIALTMR